jgi:2-oxoglutarate dehydrogenase E2 component (dihydrolipoamide succinyltransferase)
MTAEGLSPAVQRMVLEHNLDPQEIEGTGKGGRILKGDVIRFLESGDQPRKAERQGAPADEKPAPPAAEAGQAGRPSGSSRPEPAPSGSPDRQIRTPMSRLRQRLAQRLVEVQQTAAILTTFNEADMSRVMALRAAYKESFKQKHGVGLGFMSFFVKAVVDALKTVPEVNAYIDGDEIVRNHYYDIGIAVSTDKGLVVPVLRNADRLSAAEIESGIADLAQRAQERRLDLSDLTGAVFTISNGGVFGSLLSTPILNPPGSAILGMHAIQKRPIAVEDQVVVRPMMYLALSYDHRIIDGREAVTFLKRIAECIENPERMMLEV